MFRKVAICFVLLFAFVHVTAFAAPLARAEEEGNPWWLWLIIFAVLALFVGFMLWWWLHEPEEEEFEAAHHPPVADVAAHAAPQQASEIPAAEVEVSEPAAAHVETAPPQAAEPDDLTVVEGIGPAIQKVFYAAGIHTYADLAAADPDRLEAILQEADAKLARLFDPSTWPQQARLAALGQWEELDTLKRQLNAGRRV